MTTPPQRATGSLPDREALIAVCRKAGMDSADARLLHRLSNSVYLLPREDVVVRLAPDTKLRVQRANTVIAVTRWLASHSDSIALTPISAPQPVIADGAVATFWPYQPTTPPPSLNDLAAPLLNLHALPDPPFPVPNYRPLHRLHEALALDRERLDPALRPDDRSWLEDRAARLVDAYTHTEFPLGVGLVHADSHSANLVRKGSIWVLIDWDQTCLGARELDLLSGLPDHFQEREDDRKAFLRAYGYDLTAWSEWSLLRDIAELHSLASYIRRSLRDPRVAGELDTRIRSLRTGDTTVKWRSISF